MEKNMHDNFNLLSARVCDALDVSNLKKIRKELSEITGPTICVGVGGSNVVSEFTSKVLASKNHLLALNKEPRNLLYEDLSHFQNVIACSYSGRNYGVDLAFNNSLNKYLLSNNQSQSQDVINLQYLTTIPAEKSFISLAATLIPMTILLDYYLDGNRQIIDKLFSSINLNFQLDKSKCYEIMSGIDTSTAHKFLESTFIEAGIAIPIIHDKYSYCHGRSTTSFHHDNALIYLNRNNEIDYLIIAEAEKYYRNIIVLDAKYQDPIIADFNLTLQAMFLAKAIAEKKQKDLSGVDYSPFVKKLYKYKGGM